jgi:hypothetical protein
MTNKKLLYGALLVGAVAGLYFWNKNKKPAKCVSCAKATDENYSSVTGSGCRVCETVDSRGNTSTYFATSGNCNRGGYCIVSNRVKSLTSL